MLYVSIVVELLRARPALAVWIAALLQAAVWTLVPALFYSGPPGDVPAVLALGHEFRLGTNLGPPLAYWLAEAAFRLTGGGIIGVYALSQVCVVATYWAVFALGRAIAGAQHAALAVLLMVGIAAFTVPTPDFGPVNLTMLLWALMLLHYWQAVTGGARSYWIALAVEAALLLITSYAALLFIGMLALFTGANRYARGALRSPDPWIAGAAVFFVSVMHLVWLANSGAELMPEFARLRAPESVVENFSALFSQTTLILAAHAGLALLIALVVGWPRLRTERAPVILRRPLDDFARHFVYFFALVPVLAATFLAVLLRSPGPLGGIAPLVVLSGLAVVVAAGDGIKLTHQRFAIAGWFGLLLVPPLLVMIALAVLPWLAVDLNVNRPVETMARFFAESFQRRTGVPLPIVAGDPRTAALIALGTPNRPSLFLAAEPAHSPWVTLDDIRIKGAILVWPTTDTAGTPPAVIRARFPDLVLEVPRAFERPIAGRLGLLRIGWAVIRPQGAPVDAPGAMPAPPPP
jgi:Dolichyl-phosphate-mannose-protein mannosyltransferase